MNINVTMPTKHQAAVIASHLVVGAGSAIAALSFFGALDASQVKEATQDVDHIAADLKDLYGSIASLATLAMIAYSAVKSGPFASFFRSAAAIAGSPKMIDQVKLASFDQKVNVVAITDQLPEVAGVATIDTRSGQALATAVPSNTVQVGKVAAVLLAMFVVGMMAAAPASAQPKAHAAAPAAPTKACPLPWDPLGLCGLLTGNISEDVQRVSKRIAKINKDDLTYAIAKAKGANTNGSKVRLQCLTAISAAADQVSGDGLKDAGGNPLVRPDPALITDIEDIAELIDNLSPQGVLLTACAGTAQMFKVTALQAVNGIVTGAAGLAAASAVGL